MSVGVMSFLLVCHIHSTCVPLMISLMMGLMSLFWWKRLLRGKTVLFSECVFWDSGVMNQQRVLTAHLQTATQQRFWEVSAFRSRSFRVGPALLSCLFPHWLQHSQPDKSQTNTLRVPLFDSPAQICAPLQTTVWAFQSWEKHRHGNLCCPSTNAGAGLALDKRWSCIYTLKKKLFSLTQPWKMACTCVLHKIRKIFRSADGTATAFSLTISIYATLAYVLNVFLFV